MKRSWLIISLFIIAALAFVNFSHRNDKSYYLWTGKILSRADFYDRCKEVTDQWTKDEALKKELLNSTTTTNSNLKFLKADSYRNEDIYVFEIKIGVEDTAGISSIAPLLEQRLTNDKVLEARFFGRLNQMRNLITFSDTTDKSNVSVDALMMREYIKFQTLANLENSQRMLSYTFPKNNEFVKIEQSNSRSYIFAIVLALVAGFFTIIVLKKIGGPRN